MNNIKAIVFDMDGILLDSESLSDRTWKIAFEERGMKMNMDVLNGCRGLNKHDSALYLKKVYGQDFDADSFFARTSQLFHQIEEAEGLALMPYVKEILDYLSTRYVLALASSTRKESVVKELTDAGLINYFKTLTTGDMVTHSKPDPEIYKIACESIGFKPEECAGIEDSINGVKSSSAAGLVTFMVPDKQKPTVEVEPLCYKICSSLKDLKEYL